MNELYDVAQDLILSLLASGDTHTADLITDNLDDPSALASLMSVDPETYAEWTTYTNPDTKQTGWISDGGQVRYERPSGPGDQVHDDEPTGRGHAPPDTKSLENAVDKKRLHPGVAVRSDSAGRDWVVKGRVGKAAQVANEAAAASLAAIGGASVVPVHHVKLHGQDHAVLPMLDGYSDVTKLTNPADIRAAFANVPKQQIDSHALFDYAIGSSDPNLGNYLVGKNGTDMVAIDKEQSLGMGQGNKTTFATPDILSFVVPPGKAAVDHVFDRAEVSKMAANAEQMATKLEQSGRKKDAVGVRNRAAVLKQLAEGAADPTAGELARLGEAANATAKASSGGFFGKIKSIFGG